MGRRPRQPPHQPAWITSRIPPGDTFATPFLPTGFTLGTRSTQSALAAGGGGVHDRHPVHTGHTRVKVDDVASRSRVRFPGWARPTILRTEMR